MLWPKKKHEEMEKERKKFVYGYKDGEEIIKGCVNNGIDEKIAHKIFDQMVDFASYAFNKSHVTHMRLLLMKLHI